MADLIDITQAPYNASIDNSDNIENIQKALDEGQNIYIPEGIFKISRSLHMPKQTTLSGAGTLQLTSKDDTPILKLHKVTNVSIHGLTLDSMNAKRVNNTYASVFVAQSEDIKINDLKITNTTNYGIEVEDTEGIEITNCNLTNFGQRAINIVFSNHTHIVNNIIDGQLLNNRMAIHGIEIWGKYENEIRSVGHTVANNKVMNVRGGGIWTSWVRDIIIIGNYVENCHDVCIDVEGTENAKMIGNVAKNGKNGGMCTFFASRFIDIDNNKIIQEKSFGPGIRIFGKGISRNIGMKNNTIRTYDSEGVKTDQETLAESNIMNNYIYSQSGNGILMLEANNMNISNNLISTKPLKRAISIEGGNSCVIQKNKIDARPTAEQKIDNLQTPKLGAIYLYWRNKEYSCQHNKVLENVIKGYQISINDNCWGNSNSKNLIQDNTADKIVYNKQSGNYGGTIKQNISSANTRKKSEIVTY